MTTIPEHKILRPRDPSIEDDNEWEQFQLSHVEVRNTTTNGFSNLLLADAHNPLCVTGRLANVEPEQAHLRKFASNALLHCRLSRMHMTTFY